MFYVSERFDDRISIRLMSVFNLYIIRKVSVKMLCNATKFWYLLWQLVDPCISPGWLTILGRLREKLLLGSYRCHSIFDLLILISRWIDSTRSENLLMSFLYKLFRSVLWLILLVYLILIMSDKHLWIKLTRTILFHTISPNDLKKPVKIF